MTPSFQIFSKLRPLDEIDVGLCDGMSYDEIVESMPEEYEARSVNKLVTIRSCD